MMNLSSFILLTGSLLISSCSKKTQSDPGDGVQPGVPVELNSIKINGTKWNGLVRGVDDNPAITIDFSEAITLQNVQENISLSSEGGDNIPLSIVSDDQNKSFVVTAVGPLAYLTSYSLTIGRNIGTDFNGPQTFSMNTGIDSSDKFPIISDEALLEKIQKQTFRYFWNFGHPVSGMARERSTSGDVVTTGGTGFGVMAIIVGIHRQLISRSDGLECIQQIVSFLKDKCTTYHGAFAHWINGNTGETVPFSEKDNGGDLVETSLLFQGLLTARQFFDRQDAAESQLRSDINALWNNIDFTWYQNGQNVLMWHWSPEYDFQMNLKISGWNESLITYVLAASSPTHSISREVYDQGWAREGAMKNGNIYFNEMLPLGPAVGGPLFFAHYSFLGLNPNGLKDAYADYFEQNKAHTSINQKYCIDNPKQYYGYSNVVWGLTASDDNQSGYTAHSPTNDDGVISPTAAVSSLPYLPDEAMASIRFFYYKLGDKIWGDYGFMDAFNLNDLWYSGSYLAIDQGPQIVMIENYRSGLLWNLFMSCAEVQNGLDQLGFSY